jgi:uncharacterized protein (DUF427 family)
MSEKPVMIPGPDHPITVTPSASRVVVTAGGRVIADTGAALTLQESNYPAVQYIPRSDADLAFLERTEHESYCPFKGDASYFSIPGIPQGENAIWTYESPYDAVHEIKDHLAFYPGRVTIEELPLGR